MPAPRICMPNNNSRTASLRGEENVRKDNHSHESVDAIRSNMVAQITGSVRWVECTQYLVGQGVTEMVECGPGKVLAGLMKRIDRSVSVTNIGALSDLEA